MVALAITFGVLIYAWGRTLLEGVMINGRPKPLYVVMLVAGVAAVMSTTSGLSQRLRSPRLDRIVLRGVAACWIVGISIAMWFVVGRLLPKFIVVPLFMLASLWVVCLAWMLYRPWPWNQRIVVLALCVLFQVGFVALFRVEGIQGQFQVDFTWRSAPRLDHGAALPIAVAPPADDDQTPDLSRTTSHDYSQYLGPDRSAVVMGDHLSADWAATPPREVWRKEVGAGWSAFAIVGDYAITQEQRGTNECVVCYRLADGHTEWVHSDESRFESSMGGIGPRATPTIAEGRVYTVGGKGLLNCLDGANGKAIWTVNILKDNGGGDIAHGVCGSPLVVDDWVIVSPTGIAGASLVAYDKQTGDRVWQGGKFQASYSSPALAELGGIIQLLLVTHDGIEGNDVKTGKTLWNYTWSGDLHVNCSQPIIVDAQAGRILYCTGYGKGCVLLEATAGPGEAWAVKEVWQAPGKMKTKFTTAVLHGGYAYGLDEGILACLDVQTGKQLWKGGRYSHGQVLLADDLLLIQAEAGEVYLVQPDPKKLIELGRIPALTSKTWNNPALAGNKLLVRNDREAVCYELPVRGKAKN
jgi:outer membrane protein assembly factor BamB